MFEQEKKETERLMPSAGNHIRFLPHVVADEGYSTKGEGMMRAINRLLEEVIREHPDQWLWFHDRWRYARRKGLL